MTASAPHSMLPSLTAGEKLHSEAVTALIRSRIEAAGGWLSFADFMELALYAPGWGYYSAGSVKLGAGGDFVTAPEISDLFSRCVARQCADVLSATGGDILELGAGTGRMAACVLQSLAEIGVLPERYAILEVSGDLSERQRARLASLPKELQERVVWLDQLPAAGAMRGVVLANEVLDALPVQRFVVRDGVARELGVGLVDAGLNSAESAAFGFAQGAGGGGPGPGAAVGSAQGAGGGGPGPGVAVGSAQGAGDGGPGLADGFGWELSAEGTVDIDVGGLPDGYISEICTRVDPWIAGVGQCLSRGALLLFDYGLPHAHYYHPQRVDGTLRCYFKQRAHNNPFINIGVQDITAWVDFTRVADAALAAGLDVSGFVTQAAFLLGNGIEAMTLEVEDVATRARLAGEARRLLMPGEMGESFKVMALCRDLDVPLRGFALQDLRRSL
jgi:SAM-dependent MidA family methyltransferase